MTIGTGFAKGTGIRRHCQRSFQATAGIHGPEEPASTPDLLRNTSRIKTPHPLFEWQGQREGQIKGRIIRASFQNGERIKSVFQRFSAIQSPSTSKEPAWPKRGQTHHPIPSCGTSKKSFPSAVLLLALGRLQHHRPAASVKSRPSSTASRDPQTAGQDPVGHRRASVTTEDMVYIALGRPDARNQKSHGQGRRNKPGSIKLTTNSTRASRTSATVASCSSIPETPCLPCLLRAGERAGLLPSNEEDNDPRHLRGRQSHRHRAKQAVDASIWQLAQPTLNVSRVTRSWYVITALLQLSERSDVQPLFRKNYE